jgi:hypothetical protein
MTKTPELVKTHNYFSMSILENPNAFVRSSHRFLKDAPEFDTFVVRGMSGAIAGGILARSCKKNLYVIRKPNDGSHDGNKAFGIIGSRWLFLDDFVSSGDTFWQTYDTLRLVLGSKWGYDAAGIWSPMEVDPPEFVGAYLYARGGVLDAVEFQDHLRNYNCTRYLEELK